MEAITMRAGVAVAAHVRLSCCCDLTRLCLLVASPAVQDLLFCAKHLFAAASTVRQGGQSLRASAAGSATAGLAITWECQRCSLTKMLCTYFFFSNRWLRASPCTLISLSKRRSHLPVSGRPSRPDALSLSCRVPRGSFPKSSRARSTPVLDFIVAVLVDWLPELSRHGAPRQRRTAEDVSGTSAASRTVRARPIAHPDHQPVLLLWARGMARSNDRTSHSPTTQTIRLDGLCRPARRT